MAVQDFPRAGRAVTTSDTTDQATDDGVLPNRLYIGVSGDVAVQLQNDPDGTTVIFKAHPVGYLFAAVRKVLVTGTTATNILALYS